MHLNWTDSIIARNKDSHFCGEKMPLFQQMKSMLRINKHFNLCETECMKEGRELMLIT